MTAGFADGVHRLPLRVYYEDTDAGGIVYYANYLRFAERGRTEFLRALGFQQQRITAEQGIVFPVRSLTAEYFQPARLDDELIVRTALKDLGRAQVIFDQRIERADPAGGEAIRLFEAQVRIACLDINKNKPVPMPHDIHQKFKALTA